MLLEKLSHSLPEVRRPALRSLHFKLQHGLLAADYAALAEGGEHLLAFLELSGEAADTLAALNLLGAMAKHPAAAAQLLRLGADRALIQLADGPPPCAQPATALLGELLCSAADEPSGQQWTAGTLTPVQLPQHRLQGRLEQQGCMPLEQPTPSSCIGSPASPSWLQIGRASAPLASHAASKPPAATLASWSRQAPAVSLSEDDSQQLFEVALELQQGQADDASLLATLATLCYGVLADMPPTAVASEPAVVRALLRLLDGARGRPVVAAAALQVVHALAEGLAAAGEAPEGAPSLPLAPFAYDLLLRCAALLNDGALQHGALAAAQVVVPLLRPVVGRAVDGVGASAAFQPLLSALTESLRLCLVAECTAADIPPPSSWADGFHALVLGPASCGILRLVADITDVMPQGTQALPPLLCDMLAALTSHPVAAAAAPELHGFARRCLPDVRPAAQAQLESAARLSQQRDSLMAAVRQLANAGSAAVAAACCRDLQQQLPALELLAEDECGDVVHLRILAAATRHSATSATITLAAQLLLHHRPVVREAALRALIAACKLGSSGALLPLHPPATGALIMALGDEQAQHRQLAADLLQAVASAGGAACGHAFAAWEPWLLCYASCPVAGPAVAAVLQLATAQKPGASIWQHLAPVLQALFHSSPAVAADAAAQLHALLVQRQPAAATAMLFNPLPFDGMLMPACGATGGAAARCSRDAASVAAASASKLFTAADVQSLLAVMGSTSLPPELTAAALGQLAQVAGDERFAVMLASDTVLAALVAHASDALPLRHTQLPALQCLVAVVQRHPAAAEWLLAGADSRVVPLLPLVFHPLPAQRQHTAELLHNLLFAAAARQLHSLAGQTSSSTGSPAAAAPGRGDVPEAFCAAYCFPPPAAVLPLSAAQHRLLPDVVFGSEQVQRLWRAQQLCKAAASGSAGNSSLLELLAAPASLQRWEAELVHASLATLRGLQPAVQAQEALLQLESSQDHAQCRAALARLGLLAAALLEGLTAIAATAWHESLSFLLSAAPLSPEDCELWQCMLPLLRRLVSEGHVQQPQLLFLAERFAGASAYTWLQQGDGCNGQQAAEVQQARAALLPSVLDAVTMIAQQTLRLSSPASRTQLLEAMRAGDWLALLCSQLQQGGGGYASKVAFLRLAAVLVGDSPGLPAGAGCSTDAGSVFAVVVRRVLMPRELWSTEHCHGKAAVQAGLALLLRITQAATPSDWAAGWADVGSTYWLSRAAADSNVEVRQSALRLLAAAAAVPPTHGMLCEAWPDCADVAVRAAACEAEPVGCRAAALAVVAAALSHGVSPKHSQSTAMQLTQPSAEQLQQQHRADASSAEPSESSSGTAENGPLAMVPTTLPSLAAERLLQLDSLWASVHSILQDCNTPCLLSAAAHAAMQRLLLDADGTGAGGLLDSSLLLRLLRLVPLLAESHHLAVADGHLAAAALAELSAEEALLLQQAVQAAHAAAGLIAAACQLADAGIWSQLAAGTDLLPAAALAFGWTTAIGCAPLPQQSDPAVRALQLSSQATLTPLANAAAVLLQASGSRAQAALAACSCPPLPLAAAVATALSSLDHEQGPNGRALRAASCRLLATALQEQESAAAFLLPPGGDEEHEVTLPKATTCAAEVSQAGGRGCTEQSKGQPVGGVLCTHMVGLFAATAANATCGAGGEQQALEAALGGLLAFSQPAKQVAVSVGLHASLVDSCCSLAASLRQHEAGVAEPPVAPAPPAAAVHIAADFSGARRTSKLQLLKKQRGGRQPVSMAFGSRVPASKQASPGAGRATARSQGSPRLQQAGCEPAQPSTAGESPAAPVERSRQALRASHASRQRLLLCLRLLQHLAHGSSSSSHSMVAAGLLDAVAAQLWGAACSAVQHALLSLLATILGNSAEARKAFAATGQPCLLERLVALVLGTRSVGGAGDALSAFAATPDGAHTLVHSSELLHGALRSLQDAAAIKAWKRLLPVLQVLADLASQPEGQRALLRCTSPSSDMLGTLLALAEQQHSRAVAEAGMLVVRQVALCPEAKAHMVSRHGTLQQLVDAVAAAAQQPGRAAAAASALWALVHGGERVKVALRRCEGWAEGLKAGLAACQEGGDEQGRGASWRQALRQACEALQQLLS